VTRDEVVSVKFTRSQVAALLVLLERANQMPYPAALRLQLLGARNQLERWQRAASPADVRELEDGTVPLDPGTPSV
jgi:hypothetical protein